MFLTKKIINFTALFLLIEPTLSNQKNCLPRKYTEESIVCVCSNKHCDSIPKIQKTDPNYFVTYTSDKQGQRFSYQKNKIQQLEYKKEEFKEYSNKIYKDYIIKESPVDKECDILINQDVKYQNIIGWGGAFTDSTGINIKSLNTDLQNILLRSYFSEDGLEYNLGRVPIAGTDFSTRGYTYLDTQYDGNYKEDPLLTKFRLVKEDYQYKIPLIKEAQKLNENLLLLASAWTAPKWMKENEAYNGILAYLKKEMYQPWANYFIKFLDAYNSHNITFWGVTTGNEVYFAMAQSSIPSVLWTPDDMSYWIKNYFGPTIKNSSHYNIKILTNDDNRPTLGHSLDTVFKEEKNIDYIDGIAIHWYFDKDYNTHVLQETHQKYPDKFLLYTEACSGIYPEKSVLLGSWQRGEKYAANIIEDLNNWVTGWMDWNMALDLTGGPTYVENYVDSSVIVNATGQEFYKQPMYYAIGHFSKFIPRDSTRIYSSQCDKDLKIVALKRPDGGVVVVVLNRTDKKLKKVLMDPKKGKLVLDVAPSSISTIIYW